MGRSTTTKYALEMDGVTSRCWHIGKVCGGTGDGKPNYANLVKYVEAYHASLESGGVNAHISKAMGYIPYANWARIVVNGSREMVVEWKAPMFMIVGGK